MNDSAHPSPEKKPALLIGSESEFEALMEVVDKELVASKVPIVARPLSAYGVITKKYDIVLELTPHKQPLIPGLFTPSQISLRIEDWMNRRYGDRIKIDGTMGRVVFPFRGAMYSLRCPLIFGTARLVLEPQSFGVKRSPIGVDEYPVVNMLDLIDGFTAALAVSINPTEAVQIVAFTTAAINTHLALHAVDDVRFVGEAIGDLEAVVQHLMASKPQFGLGKWSSLQASEKMLKAYIATGGGAIGKHHRLHDHAADAAKLGMPPPPDRYLNDLQCSAGVRYGEPRVTVEDAIRAQFVSLEICAVAARSIARRIGRSIPPDIDPLVDEMPLSQFLKKHSKPGK